MNDRDSEALIGLFLDRGYKLVDKPDQADVLLVNTCSVREHAQDRAISIVGVWKKFANTQDFDSKDKKIRVFGVIGCMGKNLGEKLLKSLPHVNLICAPAALGKIPDYAQSILNGQHTRIIDIKDTIRLEKTYHSDFRLDREHGQVVISTGCSNFCAYCVVPYVRGRLSLRKPQDIINEVKRNISLGRNKITLLGQNVNDYNYKGPGRIKKIITVNFIDLLKEIEAIEDLKELNFISSNPKNTSSKLFELIAKSNKIKKHLHLPFQSGSDKILKAMNRGYSAKQYQELAKSFYDIVKGSLSTDVIVGFPGEKDDDFKTTKDMLGQLKFNFAYIFKYSPRPGTKAALLKDDVPNLVKDNRHAILLDLQKKIYLARNKNV